MKAMQLSSVAPIDEAPLSLVDLPMPEPGVGEVRLRITTYALEETNQALIDLKCDRIDGSGEVIVAHD